MSDQDCHSVSLAPQQRQAVIALCVVCLALSLGAFPSPLASSQATASPPTEYPPTLQQQLGPQPGDWTHCYPTVVGNAESVKQSTNGPVYFTGPPGLVTVTLSNDNGTELASETGAITVSAVGAIGGGIAGEQCPVIELDLSAPEELTPGAYTVTAQFTPPDRERYDSYPTDTAEQSVYVVPENHTPPKPVISSSLVGNRSQILPGRPIEVNGSASQPGTGNITEYNWEIVYQSGSYLDTTTGETATLQIPYLPDNAPQVIGGIGQGGGSQFITDPLQGHNGILILTVTDEFGVTNQTTRPITLDNQQLLSPEQYVVDNDTGLPTLDDGYEHSLDDGDYYRPSYRILHSNLPEIRQLTDFDELPLMQGYQPPQDENEVQGNPFAIPQFLPTYPLYLPNITISDIATGNVYQFGTPELTADPYSLSLITDNIAGTTFWDSPIPTYNRTYWSLNHTPPTIAHIASNGPDAPSDATLAQIQRGRADSIGEWWTGHETFTYLPSFRGADILSSVKSDGVIKTANVSFLGGTNLIKPAMTPQANRPMPYLLGADPEFTFHADYRLDPTQLPPDFCTITQNATVTQRPIAVSCATHEINRTSVNRTATLSAYGETYYTSRFTNEPLSENRTIDPPYLPFSTLEDKGTLKYEMNVTAYIDRHRFNFTRPKVNVTVASTDQEGLQAGIRRQAPNQSDTPDWTWTKPAIPAQKTVYTGTPVQITPTNTTAFEHWVIYNATGITATIETPTVTLTATEELFINPVYNQSTHNHSASSQSVHQSLPTTQQSTHSGGGNTTAPIESHPRTANTTLPFAVSPDDATWQLTNATRHTVRNDTVSVNDSIPVVPARNSLDQTDLTQLVIEGDTEAGGQINDVLLRIDRPGYDSTNRSTVGVEELLQQPFLASLELTASATVQTDEGYPVTMNQTLGAVDFPWGLTTIDRYGAAHIIQTTPNATRDRNWRELDMMTATRPSDWGNSTDWFHQALYWSELGRLPSQAESVPQLNTTGNELLHWFDNQSIGGVTTRMQSGHHYPQLLEKLLFQTQSEPEVIRADVPEFFYWSALSSQAYQEYNESLTGVDPAPLTYGGQSATPVAVNESSIPLNSSPHIRTQSLEQETVQPQLVDSLLVQNTIGEFTGGETIFGQSVGQHITTYRIPRVTPQIQIQSAGEKVILHMQAPNSEGELEPASGKQLAVVGAERGTVTTNQTGMATLTPTSSFVQVHFPGDDPTQPCLDTESYDNCKFYTEVSTTATFASMNHIVTKLLKVVWTGVYVTPLLVLYLVWRRR